MKLFFALVFVLALSSCGDICVKSYVMPSGAKCARVGGTTFIECDDGLTYINPPSYKVVCQ